MKRSIAVLSLCIIAVGLHAEPEIKGTPSDVAQYLQGISKTVTVAGDSELKASADHAYVSLRVITENKSLQEALHANQDIRSKITSTLASDGFSAGHMQASKFSSTPKYGLFGDKPRSYKVENVIKITIQNEKEFQTVAGLVDGMSEVRYDGIEFESPDKDQWKSKAVEQAMDKADQRKQLYETKLGIKLVPKSISEGAVIVQSNGNNNGYNAYGITAGMRVSAATGAPEAAPTADDETANDFGEVVYRAQVTVEYAVETK